MIIAVSSTEENASSAVDLRFGRSKFFTIYDTRNKEYFYLKNDSINESHGAGIAASQKMIKLNVDVVLTGSLGPKAFQVLDGSSIRGFKVNETTVEKSIIDFLENKLTPITSSDTPHRS